MRTSQRGSVLLTIIGGIVILALLGMVAVSLMTGSVMTGVDAKETVQASYLAESGKEIVRVQTAQADTGARLMTLADETLNGKTFAVAGGKVSLKLFPSWFRTSDTGALLKGGSGWYPNALSGTRELLLITSSGAVSRSEYAFNKPTPLVPNADVYLIGRGKPEYSSRTQSTITVSTAENDFNFFPKSGGLLGVVSKGGATLEPDSAKRLVYERLSGSGSIYTFEGVRPVSGTSYPDLGENKELVLGQYFRVASEGLTANGARGALIWHTNGKNSLRPYSGGQSGGTTVTPDASGTLSPSGSNPSQELHKEMQDLFGNNITQHNQGLNSGYEPASLASGNALITNALQPSVKNHFLLKEKNNAATTDYWFAAVTKAKTTFTGNNGAAVQISVFPSVGTQSLFAGTLFRLTTLKKDSPGDDSNAYRLGEGVAGLGMGVAYGPLTLDVYSSKVTDAPVNPALLPGFEWKNNGFYPTEDFSKKYSGTLYRPVTQTLYSLPPVMILWAYDDGKDNPPESLRWLAVSRLESKDVYYYGTSDEPWARSFFTRIVTQVQEKNGINEIQGWIASQHPPTYGIAKTGYHDPETGYWIYTFDPAHENELGYLYDWIRKGLKPSEGVVWPEMYPSGKVDKDRDTFTILRWDAVNTAYATLKSSELQGTEAKFTVLTPFATGADSFGRTGFFQGAYSATETGQVNVYRPSFRNFAAGEVKISGGSDTDAPGLTPGIVQ